MFFGYCQCLTQGNVLFDFYNVFTFALYCQGQKDQTLHGAVCISHRCESHVLTYFLICLMEILFLCTHKTPFRLINNSVSARKSTSSCLHISVCIKLLKSAFTHVDHYKTLFTTAMATLAPFWMQQDVMPLIAYKAHITVLACSERLTSDELTSTANSSYYTLNTAFFSWWDGISPFATSA